ncbi:MAG: tetraacyldisaccharide 4'-kinase [Fimbriimonadaceae bacterium]|nr:tetraacyldisaccharide 4'-kinase [Fimbriimonadaceae bacterium]
MPRIEELWEEVGFANYLLAPASWLYSAGWLTYEALYKIGLKRPKEPHWPVVCVGNLTVGGSGKSPVTIHVAQVLQELGCEVVISCSGYGSPASEMASLAPEGELSAKEWGDEPAMIRDALRKIPLIVGRNRVRAAELCHEHFPNAVLLMDDGFQHLPVKKHVVILLDDPDRKNHFCMPAGPYRQPWRIGLGKGDTVIPGEFQVEAQELQIDDCRLMIESDLRSEIGLEIQNPKSKIANALCAIARPERFRKSLEEAGLTLQVFKALPDHADLTTGTIFHGLDPNLPLIVTAKDWVKLRENPESQRFDIRVAQYSVTIQPADDFRSWLHGKLKDQIQKTV